MNAELNGQVDVTTTIGTRDGVPVIVQTKTVSITETVDGVRRSELRVTETEQPLLPLLQREQERRQAELNRAFEYAVANRPRGSRPGDRVETIRRSGACSPNDYQPNYPPFRTPTY
jgi:hypothetical protein